MSELAGAGLGWRQEFASDLLSHPRAVDLVEVVVEAALATSDATREARALGALWPTVVHGIKVSLGSADGVDAGRVRRFADLVRELRAPMASEHLAFTRGGDTEIGHLTALPFSREAVAVVARNVQTLRRAMPDVPLCLENAAWAFRWPDDEMEEGDFHHEIVRATGCPLLLDVANVYANAVNAGVDPVALLKRYPLSDVGMIHVAGGNLDAGFRYDSHAHAVDEEVFALLFEALKHTGRVPIIVERDGNFPRAEALFAEVARCREALAQSPAMTHPPRRAEPPPEASRDGLLSAQKTLATLLTQERPPDASEVAAYGVEAFARAREVLVEKRVDESLPLLSALSAHAEALRGVAFAVVRSTPRARAQAAVSDALAVARAAAEIPEMARAAARDRAVLNARFVCGGDGTMRARMAPWMGFERAREGRVWAFKGAGRGAAVRVFETKGVR